MNSRTPARLIALFLLTAFSLNAAAPLRPTEIPRKFAGKFQWADDEYVYQVTLTISKLEEKGGLFHFNGIHDYDSGAARMKVVGTIDPNTRQVVFQETELVESTYAEIDGKFLGSLSADSKKISAKWTTESTRRKGTLELLAK